MIIASYRGFTVDWRADGWLKAVNGDATVWGANPEDLKQAIDEHIYWEAKNAKWRAQAKGRH